VPPKKKKGEKRRKFKPSLKIKLNNTARGGGGKKNRNASAKKREKGRRPAESEPSMKCLEAAGLRKKAFFPFFLEKKRKKRGGDPTQESVLASAAWRLANGKALGCLKQPSAGGGKRRKKKKGKICFVAIPAGAVKGGSFGDATGPKGKGRGRKRGGSALGFHLSAWPVRA